MPRIQHANTLVSFPSPATEFSKLSSEACIMLLGSSNPVCEVKNATRCEMQFYGYDARDTLSGGTRNASPKYVFAHIFSLDCLLMLYGPLLLPHAVSSFLVRI